MMSNDLSSEGVQVDQPLGVDRDHHNCRSVLSFEPLSWLHARRVLDRRDNDALAARVLSMTRPEQAFERHIVCLGTPRRPDQFSRMCAERDGQLLTRILYYCAGCPS